MSECKICNEGWGVSLSGMGDEVAKLLAENETLKAQLKREMLSNDFYAQNEIWVNEDDRISITYEDHFRRYPGDIASGGKLARETVKARSE